MAKTSFDDQKLPAMKGLSAALEMAGPAYLAWYFHFLYYLSASFSLIGLCHTGTGFGFQLTILGSSMLGAAMGSASAAWALSVCSETASYGAGLE